MWKPLPDLLRPHWGSASEYRDLAPLALSVAIFVGLTLVFSANFFDLYYKDEVAYLVAAERYAAGDFANAPNSLWGPGISWLVALPIALGLEPILAARIVTHLLGFATLLAANRLATTFALSALHRLIFLTILAPFLFYFSSLGLCSETALIAVLTLEFSILFDRDFPNRRRAGLYCGILGGLAYFTKGFGLPFFLAQFTICCVLFWIAMPGTVQRGKIVRQYIGGVSIFAVMAAGWIAVLYGKYGEITPGITGQYNYQIVGPGKVDRPTSQMGFVGPPAGTRVSIREDPAYLYDVPSAVECCLSDWSPFASISAFKHQLGLIKLNLGRTIESLLRFSLLSPVILGAAILCLFAPFLPGKLARLMDGGGQPELAMSRNWKTRFHVAFLRDEQFQLTLVLFTIGIFSVPYISVFSDERLLWPLVPLLVLLAMVLAMRAATVLAPRYRFAARSALAIVSVSFLVLPAWKLASDSTYRQATAVAAHDLSAAGYTEVSFASNTDYGASMVLGYYLNSQYFGQPKPGMSELDILAELQRQNVDYYLVWEAGIGERNGMELVHVWSDFGRTLAVYRVSEVK